MTLSIGARLGSHEILEPLGRGGMGEVYRARDSKLKRGVAIKILPAAFSEDEERVSRFQREAQILASLQHPKTIRRMKGLPLTMAPLCDPQTLRFCAPSAVVHREGVVRRSGREHDEPRRSHGKCPDG